MERVIRLDWVLDFRIGSMMYDEAIGVDTLIRSALTDAGWYACAEGFGELPRETWIPSHALRATLDR